MKLIQTDDGSHTIYLPQLDETYHSTFGAIQESEHVFINAALGQCPKQTIELLEIGFGTGLNAYLTMLYAERNNIKINYHTVELFPINRPMAEKLNFTSHLKDNHDFIAIHSATWEKNVNITSNFVITKHKADFIRMDYLPQYDVCYFDAFSPDKQPDMWQLSRFELLYSYANHSAILTTYCAKGEVRRNMLRAGFVVERLPGPKGKREILRAKKIGE